MKITLRKDGYLKPGSSPYWCDHKSDWQKLREYREDMKQKDFKGPQVVIDIDVDEWCQACGYADAKNKEEVFLKITGFKKMEDAKPNVQTKEFRK